MLSDVRKSRSKSSLLESIGIMNHMNMAHKQRMNGNEALNHFDREMIEHFRFISACLPDFTPIRKHESKILDQQCFHLLTMYLPGLVKMREWCLLFSIERDGTSFQTFFDKVEDRDNTILIIQDEHDDIFGAFMVEEWHYDH